MKELTQKEYAIESSDYVATGLTEIANAELLSSENSLALKEMEKELLDTWQTERIWRTETEMRYSVLEDVKHPTRGMKYLQARREQDVFFRNLMYLSAEYKENRGKLLQAEGELEELLTEEPSKIRDGKVIQKEAEIQRLQWNLMEQRKAGHHRVRELKAWSKIKDELNDGSFDPNDYESIQREGLQKRWQNQVNIGKDNLVGPLSSITKAYDNESSKNS